MIQIQEVLNKIISPIMTSIFNSNKNRKTAKFGLGKVSNRVPFVSENYHKCIKI